MSRWFSVTDYKVVTLRFAKVRISGDPQKLFTEMRSVERYLPKNYRVQVREDELWIDGYDDHGWTLDGYVIPRLASALIRADEVAVEPDWRNRLLAANVKAVTIYIDPCATFTRLAWARRVKALSGRYDRAQKGTARAVRIPLLGERERDLRALRLADDLVHSYRYGWGGRSRVDFHSPDFPAHEGGKAFHAPTKAADVMQLAWEAREKAYADYVLGGSAV